MIGSFRGPVQGPTIGVIWVDAAKAWARGGDRAKYDAALANLSITEEFHGYPGLQLMGALRGAAAAGDGASSLALATRNTQALATRSFRQHSDDCNAKDDGNGDVPELVPPTFGAHTTRRLGYVALLLAQ
ncbi:hypothetical protein [Bradyrhizobium liaoningense]